MITNFFFSGRDVGVAVTVDVNADVDVGSGFRPRPSGRGLRPESVTAGDWGSGFLAGAPGRGLRIVESGSGFRDDGVNDPFGEAAVIESDALGDMAGGTDVLGAGEALGPGDVLCVDDFARYAVSGFGGKL